MDCLGVQPITTAMFAKKIKKKKNLDGLQQAVAKSSRSLFIVDAIMDMGMGIRLNKNSN